MFSLNKNQKTNNLLLMINLQLKLLIEEKIIGINKKQKHVMVKMMDNKGPPL